MAHLVTWLWFDVIRFRRRLILDNLRHAFPEWTESRRREVGRRSVWHLVYSAMEAFMLPFLRGARLEDVATVHDLEIRDRAAAAGRGVCLLVMHLGNVERLIAAAGIAGMRTHVLAKPLKSPFFHDLVYGTRKSFGTEFIDNHGPRTAFEILHALRRGEYVAFILDQFIKSTYGVPTTFFGRPVTTGYGLALFVRKTGAPVLPVYSYRDATDRMHVCFDEIVQPVEDPDRDRALQAMTQRYNDTIEAIIRRHPEQWFWVHNRWKPAR
jgi:KDO2-lipid IV(A) lauroyltransferase